MRDSSTLPFAPTEYDPRADMACSLAWSRCPFTAESSRKEGKIIAHPLQHSWTVGATSAVAKHIDLPVDVHLYVRGGDWIAQFGHRLHGESGGNHNLSAIYVSGPLRKRGEVELRAKLEAKGWTLPSDWHCDEWVLWQRQGNRVVIKLAYSKSVSLEGVSVHLETSLMDPDVWWSLPVWVDTRGETVFGIGGNQGIFSPAIPGQEIAVGIANRGGECYAVMPIIDGCNILKAPYLIWPGDSTRNWEEGGASFVSFPGLQTTFVSGKRERVDVNYRPLKFAKSKPVSDSPSDLCPGQGMLRVRVFKVRKISFISDPEQALEQVEDMKGEIEAVIGPKNISPIKLRAASQDLNYYDTCVATSGADVRQTFGCVNVSWAAESLAGEVVINYRSLAWFHEARGALEKADSPPTTQHSGWIQPTATAEVGGPAPPDSIAPLRFTDRHQTRPPTNEGVTPVQRSVSSDASPSGLGGVGNIQFQTRYASPRRGTIASIARSSRLPPTPNATLSPNRSPSIPTPRVSKGHGLPTSPGGVLTSAGSPAGSEKTPPNKARRLRDLSPSQRLMQPSPRQARAPQQQLPTFRDLLRSSTPTETYRPATGKGKVTPVGPNLRTANRMREKMAAEAGQQKAEGGGGVVGGGGGGGRGSGGREASGSPSGAGVWRKEKVNFRRSSSSTSSTSTQSDWSPEVGSQSQRVLFEAQPGGQQAGAAAGATTGAGAGAGAGAADCVTLWVVPHVGGKEYQKDEIEVKTALRNVANLRRQVKADLAPLFEDWSTAEMSVMVGGKVISPETLLSSLPKGAGSAGDPFVVEAGERGVEGLRRSGSRGEGGAAEGGRGGADVAGAGVERPEGAEEGGSGGGEGEFGAKEQVEEEEGKERPDAEVAVKKSDMADDVADAPKAEEREEAGIVEEGHVEEVGAEAV